METTDYVSEVHGEIFALSDTHLGSKRTRPKDFNKFLDYSIDYKNLDGLVTVGDIIDDWRGDIGRILFQNADAIHKLRILKEKLEGDWVIGNHDYSLIDFRNNNGCSFKFPREFSLKTGETRYKFMHGDQFDPTQFEFLYKILCERTDDHLGGVLSNVWLGFKGVQKLYKEFLLNVYYRSKSEIMLKPPEERKIADIVEENAKDYIKNELKKNEKLVCGHTHTARIDNEARYYNCGAWTEDVPNTFLRIKGDNVKLEEF